MYYDILGAHSLSPLLFFFFFHLALLFPLQYNWRWLIYLYSVYYWLVPPLRPSIFEGLLCFPSFLSPSIYFFSLLHFHLSFLSFIFISSSSSSSSPVHWVCSLSIFLQYMPALLFLMIAVLHPNFTTWSSITTTATIQVARIYTNHEINSQKKRKRKQDVIYHFTLISAFPYYLILVLRLLPSHPNHPVIALQHSLCAPR